MKAKALLLAIFISIAGVTSAQAHSSLVSSLPKSNAILKKLPNQVLLNFNESLLKIGTRAINKISILGPKGEYGVGVTTVSGRQISRIVRTSNDKGNFLINWRAVSEDGHVVNGHINFKVI